MEPVSSEEYNLLQRYAGIANKLGLSRNTPNKVSTITGKPMVTAAEEFSSRAGLLSSMGDMYSMLEGTYDRDPGFVLGGIARAPIKSAFAEGAKEVRHNLYRTLKDTYKKYDDKLIEQMFSPALTDAEWNAIEPLRKGLKDTFKDHIRGVKGMPDTLMNRVESYKPITEKGTVLGRWWPDKKELQLNQKIAASSFEKPSVRRMVENEVKQVVRHEQTHIFQDSLFDAVRKNEAAPEVVRNLPSAYQEVVFNNEMIHGWHRAYASLPSPRKPGVTTYKEFYNSWPTELQAKESQKLGMQFVGKNGRQPTMIETFDIERQAQRKVMDAWKRTAPKTYKQAVKEAQDRIKLKYDVDHTFDTGQKVSIYG